VKAVVIVLALAVSTPAFAQEPVGCDKFKWPLDKERATLTGTDLPKVASGNHVKWPIPFGMSVALLPFAEVKLPMPPERPPESPTSFFGFVEVLAPAKAGTYKITLSSEGWIDVAQDGKAVESTAFSGALGCNGIRKSVKFDLAARPLTIELSNVPANAIGIVVSGD
jgi:hypothetical protein